jgi:NAD+ kinase
MVCRRKSYFSGMKVAIYSRGGESVRPGDVHNLLDALRNVRITPVLHEDIFHQVSHLIEGSEDIPVFRDSRDLDEHFDCLVSLGGDGTLLDTVTLVRDKNIPVLGINFGRLGFLASLGKENLDAAVRALADRNYMIDKRTLIHLDADVPLFGETPYALNEFVIHKRDVSPMIRIHTYLNGEPLNNYWADGLIVATPTGSTGYSLSCNGPLLFPDAGGFIINPVAPHNLNVRPIVVPDDSVISFEVEGRTDQLICTMDSRKEIVDRRVQLAVKKESFRISLIRLQENTFLQTLREKLAWGLDARN